MGRSSLQNSCSLLKHILIFNGTQECSDFVILKRKMRLISIGTVPVNTVNMGTSIFVPCETPKADLMPGVCS